MKTLVFAEKPSVGRDIAKVLQATAKKSGYIEGRDYVITWGFGHLVSLGHPELQNASWKKWSLDSLPMLPSHWKLSVIPSAKQQFETVSKLMNRTDINLVINAADAGREGELIFRLVYKHSGCDKTIKRLWISSMTDNAIKAGFENIEPGEKYDSLASAAICRSRADWLVGMNLTRGYTKKIGQMLTVGRVQTPTLAMVVNRHLEILNFVSKDYWEISANMGDFSAIWFDPKEKEHPARIDKLTDANQIIERCTGQEAKVKTLKKSKKKILPPFLYDLTTLQRDANTKFSMTAAETLKALQSLYEKRKAVTYPRTDSKYLSDDIFKTIPARLAALPNAYDKYLDYLRANRPKKTKRVFNNSKVSDHHAVIPTEKKISDTSSWQVAERKIYDLIVRRFLAAFYSEHLYLSTSVIIETLKTKDHFKATGKIVTDIGWKTLYQTNKNNAESETDQSLPEMKKNDALIISDAKLLVKKTKPPAYYTEATLLQAMETAGKLIEDEELKDAMKDAGLGTPATRAEIIEKLIRIEYMVRDKKKLIPTPKGVKLVSLVASEVKSPELTGKWEKRLADIARSRENDVDFMNDIEAFVKKVVVEIKQSNFTNIMKRNSTLAKKRVTYGKCPACGKGEIIEGKRGFGCNRFREGCTYVVWKEFQGKVLSKSMLNSLIAGKPTRVAKGFILENGEQVSGKIKMKDDKTGIEFVLSKPKA